MYHWWFVGKHLEYKLPAKPQNNISNLISTKLVLFSIEWRNKQTFFINNYSAQKTEYRKFYSLLFLCFTWSIQFEWALTLFYPSISFLYSTGQTNEYLEHNHHHYTHTWIHLDQSWEIQKRRKEEKKNFVSLLFAGLLTRGFKVQLSSISVLHSKSLSFEKGFNEQKIYIHTQNECDSSGRIEWSEMIIRSVCNCMIWME